MKHRPVAALRHLLLTTAMALCAAATGTASAGSVTLTGWAYGPAVNVNATNYRQLPAGAFAGTVQGSGGSDTDSLVAWRIEIDRPFSFSAQAVDGYSEVDSFSRFAAAPGRAGMATALSQLLGWADAHADQVATPLGAAAMQLAIWNTLFDTDALLTRRSAFFDRTAAAPLADIFLAGAASFMGAMPEIFVLTHATQADLLVLRHAPAAAARNDVPEPGGLPLAMLALAAAFVAASVAGRRGARRGFSPAAARR